ncbi:MAG: hypothetical protein MUE46_05820 [Xanthomonadales bacterium]|nr:hypothetical protein [Xanthomonadales bacterium]
MSPRDLHPLTPALGLALPDGASVRSGPQGLAVEHAAQGWRLTAFQRPASVGANPAQLHAALIASLMKRHPEAAVEASATPLGGPGWQGLRSALGVSGGRTLRVLTLLETESALLVGVVLDVSAAAPASLQPEAWLRARAVPAADPEPPAKPTLSLLPLEGETEAAPAASKPTLSLAPIEGEAPPVPSRSPTAASEPSAARARFGAREPSAGPVASSLQPVAHAPPVLPTTNPYQAPDTVALEAESESDPDALRAAGRGQRVLIWCVLLSFALRGIQRNPELPMFLGWAMAVALMALAFHGVLLIASGFGYGRGVKLGLLFGSTVPLLGIGLWIWLSMKTTRALRAAGHTVGFFGVKS